MSTETTQPSEHECSAAASTVSAHGDIVSLVDSLGEREHLLDSLNTGLELHKRLVAFTDHASALNTKITDQLCPELVRYTAELNQLTGESAECRWRLHFISRLTAHWRTLQRLESCLCSDEHQHDDDDDDEEVESQLLRQPFGSLCEDLVRLSTTVDELCSETDHQLRMACELQQRIERLRNGVARRLVSMWRRLFLWRTCGDYDGAPSSVAGVHQSTVWISEQVADSSLEVDQLVMHSQLPVASEYKCAQVVFKRTSASSQNELLSAMSSLGLLDESLNQLGAHAVDRLLRPFVESSHKGCNLQLEHIGQSHVCLTLRNSSCCHSPRLWADAKSSAYSGDESDIRKDFERSHLDVGEGNSAECVSMCLPHVSSHSNDDSGKYQGEDFKRSDRPVDLVVEMMRRVVDAVRFLYEVVCCQHQDYMSLMLTCDDNPAATRLNSAFSHCVLADRLVTSISHFSHRDQVIELVAAAGRFTDELRAMGCPASCLQWFRHILFVSADCRFALEDCPVPPPAHVVDDILLNCVCAGHLSDVRQLVETSLQHSSKEDAEIVKIGDQHTDLDSDEERRSACSQSSSFDETDDERVDDEDEEAGQTSHNNDGHMDSPASCIEFNCSSPFLFPPCLVWSFVVELVKLVLSTMGLVNDVPCSCCDTSCNASSSVTPSTAVKNSTQREDISSTEPHASYMDHCIGSCLRSLWRQRLSLCVRDSLQIFASHVKSRVAEMKDQLELFSSMDEMAIWRSAVWHNSCHFVAHKTITSLFRLHLASECDTRHRPSSCHEAPPDAATTADSGMVSSPQLPVNDAVEDDSKSYISDWVYHPTALASAKSDFQSVYRTLADCDTDSGVSGDTVFYPPGLFQYIDMRRLADDCLNVAVQGLKDKLFVVLDSFSSQLVTSEKLDGCVQVVLSAESVWLPPVLPPILLHCCVNILVAVVLNGMCRRLLRQTDISTSECSRLSTVFDQLTKNLCQMLNPHVLNYLRHKNSWRRFEQLQTLLNCNLAGIVSRWHDKQLSLFTAQQVHALVRALFRNTEHRVAALRNIT